MSTHAYSRLHDIPIYHPSPNGHDQRRPEMSLEKRYIMAPFCDHSRGETATVAPLQKCAFTQRLPSAEFPANSVALLRQFFRERGLESHRCQYLSMVKTAKTRLSCGRANGCPAPSYGGNRANHKLSRTRHRSPFACVRP